MKINVNLFFIKHKTINIYNFYTLIKYDLFVTGFSSNIPGKAEILLILGVTCVHKRMYVTLRHAHTHTPVSYTHLDVYKRQI